MKTFKLGIAIIALLSSSVWAQHFSNKVVEVDKINSKIMIGPESVSCGSSAGGGTYGGGVTNYYAAIDNLHEDRVLDSFGYSITLGSPYGCKSIINSLAEGGEGFVLVNEVLETVANDAHFEVECTVSYRMKGSSSLHVGGQTYSLSSPRYYRFSRVNEFFPGVSCKDIFKQ